MDADTTLHTIKMMADALEPTFEVSSDGHYISFIYKSYDIDIMLISATVYGSHVNITYMSRDIMLIQLDHIEIMTIEQPAIRLSPRAQVLYDAAFATFKSRLQQRVFAITQFF